jgi:hypothetical protein
MLHFLAHSPNLFCAWFCSKRSAHRTLCLPELQEIRPSFSLGWCFPLTLNDKDTTGLTRSRPSLWNPDCWQHCGVGRAVASKRGRTKAFSQCLESPGRLLRHCWFKRSFPQRPFVGDASEAFTRMSLKSAISAFCNLNLRGLRQPNH